MTITPWANIEMAFRHWTDAASITVDDDEMLLTLLRVATEQCMAYAPKPLADPIPESYALATIYQAREIYAAAQRDSQDVVGVGEYVIRARPLTAAVKALIRPSTGRPRFGKRTA